MPAVVPGLWKALSNWQRLLWLLFLHLPNLLLCFLHQQNVFLSQSHISLGNIPVQSKCRRLLFLNNLSKNETIVFVWELKSLDFGKVRVSCVHGDMRMLQRTLQCLLTTQLQQLATHGQSFLTYTSPLDYLEASPRRHIIPTLQLMYLRG